LTVTARLWAFAQTIGDGPDALCRRLGDIATMSRRPRIATLEDQQTSGRQAGR
jgi:hypothetical protein